MSRLVLLAMLMLSAHNAYAAEDDATIYVAVDRAKVFRIEEEASTVVIGNPFIADVSIHDRSTLVVTGKAFGSTNLIILDANNEPIIDEMIVVQFSEDDTVTVTRNVNRQTYSCTPICNPTLRVGDSPEFFAGVQGQSTTLNGMSQDAAGGQAR
ncbi:pilus assembly protein N-terminal domain-containing protein [Roseibium sp. CAU 1637]|uniref:Pilus assembly protein N-terminal domain-containing protein n=2 Tax=Roseibium TaxID=150830 RepID=A0A939EN86_9HYPH|nr:pilus assembly protein N-terminal domain-containing protein [Roseibium limicola]MBO0345686.1 pilus assembly protein N-terminal domain-containing protein [Roseibium limicola]